MSRSSELPAPAEEGQLDDAAEAGHLGTQGPGQPGRGRRRPAGGQHVVDDQDPLAGRRASWWISRESTPYSRS